jgi:hypothetical protein
LPELLNKSLDPTRSAFGRSVRYKQAGSDADRCRFIAATNRDLKAARAVTREIPYDPMNVFAASYEGE